MSTDSDDGGKDLFAFMDYLANVRHFGDATVKRYGEELQVYETFCDPLDDTKEKEFAQAMLDAGSNRSRVSSMIHVARLYRSFKGRTKAESEKYEQEAATIKAKLKGK